jgi:hypothetical protein
LLPTPSYIRKFQPVTAFRWKNTQPLRSPLPSRLLTGPSSPSEAVGQAQNSMVNGLAAGGLSSGRKGTVVLSGEAYDEEKSLKTGRAPG